MSSDKIFTRSLQTDLMYNAAHLLRAVACMDEEAMEEISEIVKEVEILAHRMETRIGTPKPANKKPLTSKLRPHLNLVK